MLKRVSKKGVQVGEAVRRLVEGELRRDLELMDLHPFQEEDEISRLMGQYMIPKGLVAKNAISP